MSKYYLAIDIGASSGRHILSHIENGKMILEEIYRFPNGLIKKENALCWDLENLFFHIIEGMKCCSSLGKIPESVGIDTWAVDFVLLDEKNNILGNTVSYRDERTHGMDGLVSSIIHPFDLYRKTGIQKQIFNTIYQLTALKEQKPELLRQADCFLMIPDYFHFLLSGEKAIEYTNATTTQLVNAVHKTWDDELIHSLKLPKEIFPQIINPGTQIGYLQSKIKEEVGFNCKVVVPATHDTASAVMAVPSLEKNVLYISSGTWSLLGTELMEPDCSKESMERNFTNEGGYEYRYRHLKNIMGLWMIQSVKKEIGEAYSFGEICEMAEKETISSTIDCNDNRFLAPKSMSEEVKKACKEQNIPVPEGIGQVAAVIYNSLAKCYRRAVEELEGNTKQTYSAIHVVGGGANASYLNELTAKETKKIVYAGPIEATAIGNTMAQMIAEGEFLNLKEARECVLESFDICKYENK